MTTRPDRPKATKVYIRLKTNAAEDMDKVLPVKTSKDVAKPKHASRLSKTKPSGQVTDDSSPKKAWELGLPQGFRTHDEVIANFKAKPEDKIYNKARHSTTDTKLDRAGNGSYPSARKQKDSYRDIKHKIKTEPKDKHKSWEINGHPEEQNHPKTVTDQLYIHKQIIPKQEPLLNSTFKMIIMNASGSEKSKHEDPGGRRRNIIQNVTLKCEPDVMLFQEFKWTTGVTGKVFKECPIPSCYTYTGHPDASIMYKHTVVSVHDLPASELRSIVERLQRSSNNRLQKQFPLDFAPLSRMTIKKVTSLKSPEINFIVISWHGYNNNPSTGRGAMGESKKEEYFEYLMEFLLTLRVKYYLPILIGGDFNVNIQSIRRKVRSPFKICLYEASERRTKKGVIDYFIVTDEIETRDMCWFDMANETSVPYPLEVLDHDPVSTSVTINAPAKWQTSIVTQTSANERYPLRHRRRNDSL